MTTAARVDLPPIALRPGTSDNGRIGAIGGPGAVRGVDATSRGPGGGPRIGSDRGRSDAPGKGRAHVGGSSVRMRILLVGAGGTLGRAVAAELGTRHHIIAAGRKSGDVRLDLSDPASIREAFTKAGAGPLDAVVCTAGEVAFAPLSAIHPAPFGESAYTLGLTNKLLGQVNLALAAREHLVDGGSITLTSGILAEQPIAGGSSASMVNAALEGFVRAAAAELPRGIRINLVSPTILVESMATSGRCSAASSPSPPPARRSPTAGASRASRPGRSFASTEGVGGTKG